MEYILIILTVVGAIVGLLSFIGIKLVDITISKEIPIFNKLFSRRKGEKEPETQTSHRGQLPKNNVEKTPETLPPKSSALTLRSNEMGLANWFSTFCSNIQVQDGSIISTRYKNITQRLNTDFWDTTSDTSHSLYVGSYGRNTAIQGFSDLDMIFQLPYSVYETYNKYSGNGQSALLQEVKKSIEKTYSTTSIRADGQVIEVPFSDGITFEVVPAFINTDDSYTYPDANNGGKWRKTDPKPEIEAIRNRNNDCNENLVPLCKMMRAWKSEQNVSMGGLLVDTLAYQFIDDWEYKDKSYYYYDYMCRDFFLFMADQDKDQTYWLAPGSRQRVDKKGNFQWKARRCYNISLEAIEHETADPKRERSAKQKWREIFGTSFPD